MGAVMTSPIHRRLVITQNITVDGRVEMVGDWFDPAAQDDELLALLQRQMADEEILLLGRRTFEDFRGYWPRQAEDTTGITAHLNTVDKQVVSTTLGEPGWENTTVIDADALDAIRILKAESGREIICTGSITLCHALLDAGLVDEIRLFTYPVVQGRGRRLFPDTGPETGLSLRDCTTFSHGIVYTAWGFDEE